MLSYLEGACLVFKKISELSSKMVTHLNNVGLTEHDETFPNIKCTLVNTNSSLTGLSKGPALCSLEPRH